MKHRKIVGAVGAAAVIAMVPSLGGNSAVAAGDDTTYGASFPYTRYEAERGQLDRFYGYEKAYAFLTLRKLRGSICKRFLIRTHHLLQDFCTNSYELLIHFDAHHSRINCAS